MEPPSIDSVMSDLQVRRRSFLRYSHSLRIIRRSAHGIDRELPSLLFGHGWQQRLPAHEIDRLEPVTAEEFGCLERDEPQRNRARRMAQLVHYHTQNTASAAKEFQSGRDGEDQD